MNPKLTRIHGTDPSVKHSFNLKKSTSDTLQRYHLYYCQAIGVDPTKVPLKDVAEQMLIDFMASDKDFQRTLTMAEPSSRAVGQPSKTSAAAPAPAPQHSGASASNGFSMPVHAGDKSPE